MPCTGHCRLTTCRVSRHQFIVLIAHAATMTQMMEGLVHEIDLAFGEVGSE
ncbi:unnamed protein product [Sphenostylis stenocarpa]|uniref:Uncharacterized protein n=1 Tax=Sphenostylis stenocarpa TaxID=92480 RepID=A0AA86RSZ9_9FABA|nr:unnamed protein product [Sphenostylis stenocarpa]